MLRKTDAQKSEDFFETPRPKPISLNPRNITILAQTINILALRQQDYYEERYRERVLRALSQRAAKFGLKMVPIEQSA